LIAEFETLESYWSSVEAQLNKNLLEAEGIPAFLYGESTSNTMSHIATATGGVRLQVHRSDLPRAMEILQATRENHERLWESDPHQDLESGDMTSQSQALDPKTKLELATNDGSESSELDSSETDGVTTTEAEVEGETDDDEGDEDSSNGLLSNLRSIRSLIIVPMIAWPLFAAIFIVVAILNWLVSLLM